MFTPWGGNDGRVLVVGDIKDGVGLLGFVLWEAEEVAVW